MRGGMMLHRLEGYFTSIWRLALDHKSACVDER